MTDKEAYSRAIALITGALEVDMATSRIPPDVAAAMNATMRDVTNSDFAHITHAVVAIAASFAKTLGSLIDRPPADIVQAASRVVQRFPG